MVKRGLALATTLIALMWLFHESRDFDSLPKDVQLTQSEAPLDEESSPDQVTDREEVEAELPVASRLSPEDTSGGFVPRRLLVRFARETDDATIDAIATRVQAEVVSDFVGGPGVRLLRLPEILSVEDARRYFIEQPEVEAAEPDLIYHIQALPNDPDFGVYWGLENTGQEFGTPGVDIGATRAWEKTTGSKDVYIGIIDTGIDFEHIDLVDNVWVNPGEVPGNGFDDDGNGWVDDIHGTDATRSTSVFEGDDAVTVLETDPYDDNGHGTHVAGTIAARGNNGIGGSGVMWEASLIACKAFNSFGSGSLSAILECIQYFTALKDAGIDIVATNNSYGGTDYSQMLEDAIEQQQLRGMLFIAAAGNRGILSKNTDSWKDYPSGYDLDNIISVTGIDRDGLLAPLAAVGLASVDLAAPGHEIFSTFPNDTWARSSGTSMATPHVTGVVGLLKAKNPSLSGPEIKEWILSTTIPEPRLQGLVATGGRLAADIPIRDGDGDQMDDDWEVVSGLDALDPGDAALDPDDDGLTNLEEYGALTDPFSPDTDGDGLSDGDEVGIYASDPLLADSDGDSLSDPDEVNLYGTDPSVADSDGDGLTDDVEVAAAAVTDPLNSDTDGDGAADGWESAYGLDPADAADGDADADADGLSNAEEFVAGSSPNSDDSDGDGLSDFDEVNVHFSDPGEVDSDSDGMADGWEVQFGLNPNDPSDKPTDTDLDSFSNGAEFRLGTDPTDPSSAPRLDAWASLAGGSENTSYVPIDTRPQDFAIRWLIEDPREFLNATVTEDEGHIYTYERDAELAPALTVRSAFDGTVEARNEVHRTVPFGPPVLLNGSVYTVVEESPDTGYSLEILDGTTGAVEVSRPIDANWFSHITQPHGDRIFGLGANADDLRTIYSFDQTTGEILWQTPLGTESRSGTTFAVGDEFVADYSGYSLSVIDRVTGAIAFEDSDGFCFVNRGSARLIFDGSGHLYVADLDCLAKYDLADQTLLWARGTNSHLFGISVDEDFVYINGLGTVLALDAESGKDVWTWWAPTVVHSNNVATLNHVFVADETTTYALNRRTGVPEWSLDVSGNLTVTQEGTLLITGKGSMVAVDLRGDSDGDGSPDWWERHYGLAPADPADGSLDGDSDGLANSEEFMSHTNPTIADTDGDGLSDGDEVLLHKTSPIVADTDHDLLSDGDEVNVHGTDPLLIDTDEDSYTDGEEIDEYLTIATDSTSRPVLMSSAGESFENGIPIDWTTSESGPPWQTVEGDSSDGAYSLYGKSTSEDAVIEWTATFSAGDITFFAKTRPCCDWLKVFIDDVEALLIRRTEWASYVLHVTKGPHTIKWVPGPADEAWIDDVRFEVPRPLGRSSEHVLVDSGGAVTEFTVDGRRIGGSISFPTTDLQEMTLLRNHEVAALDEDRLHIYDALTDTIRTTSPPNLADSHSDGFRGIVVTDDDILVSRVSDVGGVFRFDMNGNLLDAGLIGSHYEDMTVAPDGSILALREDVAGGTIGLRANAGLIDRIDPDSLSVEETILLEIRSGHVLEVAPDGTLFVADRTCYRCLFTVRKFDATGAWIATLDAPRVTGSVPNGQITDIAYIGDSQLAMLSSTGEIITTDLDLSGFEKVAVIPNDTGKSIAAIPKEGSDTDFDGLPDWWERANTFNYRSAADGVLDTDADGLSNFEEFSSNTDPLVADTDADGLLDGFEVVEAHTDPLDGDSDDDGLSDYYEANFSGTSPVSSDTDGDGLNDNDELNVYNTDPLDDDSDDDGSDDGWEVWSGLDPLEASDASSDDDEDGLSNTDELLYGTNPRLEDSDHDGLLDSEEVAVHFTDPLNRDSDGDRVWDSWEIDHGFDPLSADDATQDADGDSFDNRTEYFAGSDPFNGAETPIARPWSAYQGNAAHTGFVPIHTDATGFTPYWMVDVIPMSSLDLHAAASGNGMVWVTARVVSNFGRLIALDGLTGDVVWTFNSGIVGGDSEPALAGNRLFLLSAGPAYLRGFDKGTGALLMEGATERVAPFDTLGPTPFDGTLYVDQGEGHVGAYSMESSQLIWISPIDESYGRTPAVSDAGVFVHEGRPSTWPSAGAPGDLARLYPDTGIRQISIPDPRYDPLQYEGQPPVLGRQEDVVVVQGGRLLDFDLLEDRIAWEIDSGFVRSPVLANGVIYAADGKQLVALEAATGAEIWRWAGPATITNNPVATLDHVLVSTDTSVHAIDIHSGGEVWSYPRGGALSLGNDRILYLGGVDGNLQAIALFPDADRDGQSDVWEASNGLSSLDSQDASADLDLDSLTNLEEFRLQTNASLMDTDGDSISDASEINTYGSDPQRADSDEDGLSDSEEILGNISDPTLADSDGDGLTDGDEVLVRGTDPLNSDTDGDLVDDYHELLLGSDPLDFDSLPIPVGTKLVSFESGELPEEWSNGAGATVGWEVHSGSASDGAFSLQTMPVGALETAAVEWTDYFLDGEISFDVMVASQALDQLRFYIDGELHEPFGTDLGWRSYSMPVAEGLHTFRWEYTADSGKPADQWVEIDKVLALTADGDNDSLPDDWELQHGLDPQDPADAGADMDIDGLANSAEFERGTLPTDSDTDHDGMTDGWEVQFGLDPLDDADAGSDPDMDGMTNLEEYRAGTDPFVSNRSNPSPPSSGNSAGGGGGGSMDAIALILLATTAVIARCRARRKLIRNRQRLRVRASGHVVVSPKLYRFPAIPSSLWAARCLP